MFYSKCQNEIKINIYIYIFFILGTDIVESNNIPSQNILFFYVDQSGKIIAFFCKGFWLTSIYYSIKPSLHSLQ